MSINENQYFARVTKKVSFPWNEQLLLFKFLILNLNYFIICAYKHAYDVEKVNLKIKFNN
jgi:hypothetical protein